MAQWTPADSAQPVEWIYKGGRNGEPTVIIRRFDVRHPKPATYYRAVTYSPNPAERELIGRYPTLNAAATVALEYSVALSSWYHEIAGPSHTDAQRQDMPAPPEMLAWYRRLEQDGTGRRVNPDGARPAGSAPARERPA